MEGTVLEAPHGGAAIHALLCVRPRDLRKSARSLQGRDGKGPDHRCRARPAGGAARAATPGTGRARGGLFLRDASPCLDPQPVAAADPRDSRLGGGKRLRGILRRPLAIPAPEVKLGSKTGDRPRFSCQARTLPQKTGVCPRFYGNAGMVGSMPCAIASGWRRLTSSRSSSTRDVGTSTINRILPASMSFWKGFSRVFGTDIATRLAAQAPKTAPITVPINTVTSCSVTPSGGVR